MDDKETISIGTIKDSICLMPWVHLHIDTSGKVKACCNTSVTYGNVRNQSVKEVWEGEKVNLFRDKLLRGEKDKRCHVCFSKEKAGKSSIRTETLDKFGYLLPKIIQRKFLLKPRYLDIRFSNVCNLKCLTCWHGASSSWFDEAVRNKTNFGDKAIIKATENNTELIAEVLDYAETVEEVYFAGGEPLLMEEHYQLLEQLLESGKQNTRLRYNTNLSQLHLRDKKAIEYWKRFPDVTVSVSVDAVGVQVEEIRRGLRWEKLLSNFLKVKTECPHVQLEIAPTISNLNVFEIGSLHRFFVENGYIEDVNKIYLNLLERPKQYNIQGLDEQQKANTKKKLEEHLNWLKQHKANQRVIDEFMSIISYMEQGR